MENARLSVHNIYYTYPVCSVFMGRAGTITMTTPTTLSPSRAAIMTRRNRHKQRVPMQLSEKAHTFKLAACLFVHATTQECTFSCTQRTAHEMGLGGLLNCACGVVVGGLWHRAHDGAPKKKQTQNASMHACMHELRRKKIACEYVIL